MNKGFARFLPMGIGERIKQAREAKGMSQDALATVVGVSRPAVSQWEDEGTEPRNKRIDRIAEALDVEPHWLLHGEPAVKGARQMPVRGEVAAGIWREAIEIDLEPIPVTPVPDYPAEAQYGLLVRGTSMNKLAADSEYLLVVDTLKTGLTARPGDVVVVQRRRHGTTEATAKRLVLSGRQLALKSESTDPRYQEIFSLGATDDETEIFISAIVLGKYTPIKRGPA